MQKEEEEWQEENGEEEGQCQSPLAQYELPKQD
jgi:hypothetical protein